MTRAYTVAAQRGLIAGEVGRGTYIRADSLANRPEDSFFGDGSGTGRPIDLSLNVPPLGDEANRLASELRSLAGSPPVLNELLRYLPHQGLPRHRHAIAGWIGRSGYTPAPSQVVLCHGAQHALSVVLAATCRSGDTVITEAVTYPGFKAAAAVAHIEVRGVATDSDGLLPDALDRACTETGARLLFTMPTLQNPIGSTMPPGRRVSIGIGRGPPIGVQKGPPLVAWIGGARRPGAVGVGPTGTADVLA